MFDTPIEDPQVSAYEEYQRQMRSIGWSNWKSVDESWTYYWWWDEGDAPPIPVIVLHSPTDDKYFATQGQHGWNRSRNVEEMGGWWMKLEPPTTVSHPDW